MREMFELECMKCGNRIFEDKIISKCVKVDIFLNRKTICNGKNRIKSTMVTA